MIGAWPPTINKEDDDSETLKEIADLLIIIQLLESRIRELEAQLETLSPGVTRG